MIEHVGGGSRLSDTIVVDRLADGSIRVEITCRPGDQSEIASAVHQLSQDCIDDAYGLYDRLRDHEAAFVRGKIGAAVSEEANVSSEGMAQTEFEGQFGVTWNAGSAFYTTLKEGESHDTKDRSPRR